MECELAKSYSRIHAAAHIILPAFINLNGFQTLQYIWCLKIWIEAQLDINLFKQRAKVLNIVERNVSYSTMIINQLHNCRH